MTVKLKLQEFQVNSVWLKNDKFDLKWPFLKLKFSYFFLPKLKNSVVKNICDLFVSF